MLGSGSSERAIIVNFKIGKEVYTRQMPNKGKSNPITYSIISFSFFKELSRYASYSSELLREWTQE